MPHPTHPSARPFPLPRSRSIPVEEPREQVLVLRGPAEHASTSGDVLGRRGALAAVLEAEPLLKRGILELLALDYECFGYEMPTVSKG